MDVENFPSYSELGIEDTGAISIQIIAKYYGRVISLAKLYKLSDGRNVGESLLAMTEVSIKLGLNSFAIKVNFITLIEEVPLPCILKWEIHFYVVLYKINGNTFFISDPRQGLLIYDKQDFINNWVEGNINEDGIVLLFETTPKLRIAEFDDEIEYTPIELENIRATEKMLIKEKKLPPASQMIRNLAIDHWYSLKAFMKSFMIIAEQDVAKRRWNTCSNCEFLLYNDTNPETKKNDGRCSHCGCFMIIKVHYVVSKCPIDKWE